MYLFINALILAVLIPSGGFNLAEEGPTCRAELRGLSLTTVVELPSGIEVEGPWRLVQRGDQTRSMHYIVVATLDRVIETDALTGGRSVIPFPQPVRLTFEGESQEEVVRRAARMWCVTVMRAQENRMLDRLDGPVPTRITALPKGLHAG